MTSRDVARCAGSIVLAAALACGSARRDEPVQREFTPANEQIALGERVFKRQCDLCHPGGASGFGPALNNKPLPGFAMRFQMRHGLGAMPAFDTSVVSTVERDAVIAYLKALRESD